MTSLINCQGLSKQFQGKYALKNVSFTCVEGEPIALIGPNGAGKTTLLSIICHFLTDYGGDIEVMGMKPGDKRLFGMLSALPQDAQLDPAFPVRKQLGLYAELQGFTRKASKNEAERVLELMDLQGIGNDTPPLLSHGMKKRAAIAQALIGSPRLVLLDEPTAGLDPANAKNIRQQISAAAGETTFLISSHNLEELDRLCSTILHLEQGCLIQQSIIDVDIDSQYLTVHTMHVDADLFIQKISEIEGVESVTISQKNEFLVCYDSAVTDPVDIKLIQCMRDNNWSYRSLTRGKTLEEKYLSREAGINR